jgi:hypothetical protein
MGDKFWAKERGTDDVQHEHDASTPKHNKGRKRLRRSSKRKLENYVTRFVDDRNDGEV